MTADIEQQTNASQEELQKFLANIAAEHQDPVLKSHVDTLQN